MQYNNFYYYFFIIARYKKNKYILNKINLSLAIMNTQNNGIEIDIQIGCRIVGYQFLWDFNNNKYYKKYAELRRFVLEKTIYDSNSEKLTGVEFFNMATH
jgi:hypothetical protein